jgi:hypothetical protein
MHHRGFANHTITDGIGTMVGNFGFKPIGVDLNRRPKRTIPPTLTRG